MSATSGKTPLDHPYLKTDLDGSDKYLTGLAGTEMSTNHKSYVGSLRHVYISMRNDGLVGSGTPSSPFSAGGANDMARAIAFTNLLVAFKDDGYVLHLEACNSSEPEDDYLTLGLSYDIRQTVGPNMKILGHGMGVTRIRLIGATLPNDIYAMGCQATVRCDGFELHGVTIDADADNQPLWTNASQKPIGCLTARGSNIYIKNCEFVGFGAKGGQEGFPVALGIDTLTGYFQDVVVEGCYVHSAVLGNVGSLSAVILNAAAPGATIDNFIVRNNRIDLLGCDADPLQGTIGTLVEGNVIIGCDHGFYHEPNSENPADKRMVIRNNEFRSCVYGVRCAAQNGSPLSYGISVIDNDFIDCSTSAVAVSSADGYPLSSTFYYRNVRVEGNEFYNSNGITGSLLAVNINSTSNVEVFNNMLDSSNAAAVRVYSTSAHVDENRKLDKTLCGYQFNNVIATQGPGEDRNVFVWAHKGGTGQTVATSTWTLLTFGSEVEDDRGYFASSRFTAGLPGKYRFSFLVNFVDLSAGNIVSAELRKNGVASTIYMFNNKVAGGDPNEIFGSLVSRAVAGDYYEIWIWHNKGSNASLAGADIVSWIQVSKV